MSELNSLLVHLVGRDAERAAMQNTGVYATDPDGNVVAKAEITAATVDISLELPAGRYRVFMLFTLAPYVWIAEAEGVEVPATTHVTLDLDQARVDEPVGPPEPSPGPDAGVPQVAPQKPRGTTHGGGAEVKG